jgi:hypothetical protein
MSLFEPGTRGDVFRVLRVPLSLLLIKILYPGMLTGHTVRTPPGHGVENVPRDTKDTRDTADTRDMEDIRDIKN